MLTERILSFLIWIPMILGQGQVEWYQETLEIEESGFNCTEEIKNTKQEFKKKMEDLENQNRNLQDQFDTLQLKLDRLLERSEGHEACFEDIGSDNCTGSKSGLIGIVEAIRVDGEWGPFSYWSQCSASCGGGVQLKERTCNNPVPKNGGKPCKGEAVEQRSCNAHLCNDCDVGERHDGNCYQLVSTPSSWYNAKLDCTRRNGSLATIPDIETSYSVAQIAGGGATRAWIGASDAETEGSWKWTNGEIATFTNWSPGNPDNWNGIQHCAVINYHTVGKWDDDSCGALHPYVCQGQNMTKGAGHFRVIGGGGYIGTSQRGGQRGYPFRLSDTTVTSTTPETSLEKCLDMCQVNSCQNDRDVRSGCNQMYSCAHGCQLRHLGLEWSACRARCNRNGQSGCEPEVNGWKFELCGKCNRGGCKKWPQVGECELGCNFYSDPFPSGETCEKNLCSSTEGCSLAKNILLTTLPELNKEFLVSFEFRARAWQSGWQNVVHFTEGEDCCNVGDRVPSLWVWNSGQLVPSFAVGDDGNYHNITTKEYSLNTWHKVEFSQTLENGKYMYRVVVDGEDVVGPVENWKPTTFNHIKVFAADNFYNPLNGSIRNLLVNSGSPKRCGDTQTLYFLLRGPILTNDLNYQSMTCTEQEPKGCSPDETLDPWSCFNYNDSINNKWWTMMMETIE